MNRRNRGVKLVELVITVAIIALLISIAITVAAEVRRRAYEPPCMANLRQIAVAFRNYCEDYEGNYPIHSSDMRHYLKSVQVLKCPRDTLGGLNRYDTRFWGAPVSYFYLVKSSEFRRVLLEKDSNHGIFYCLLHGQSRITSAESLRHSTPQLLTSGVVLRLRLDGSIERAYVQSLCYRRPGNSGIISRIRHDWHLLTNVRPCPPEICLGLRDEWQIPCPFSFF